MKTVSLLPSRKCLSGSKYYDEKQLTTSDPSVLWHWICECHFLIVYNNHEKTQGILQLNVLVQLSLTCIVTFYIQIWLSRLLILAVVTQTFYLGKLDLLTVYLGKLSLRGRRSKGKGKGIRARDRAREEGNSRKQAIVFAIQPTN